MVGPGMVGPGIGLIPGVGVTNGGAAVGGGGAMFCTGGK